MPAHQNGPRETAAGLHRDGKQITGSSRKRDRELQEMQNGLVDASTPQDVTDPRAKSELKGKVTADRWNQ